MKKYLYVLIFGAVMVSLFCLNSNAFALGGGGFRNEAALDAEANGMADVFVAQADSPSAVHYNPAGMTQLEGSYVRIGGTIEAPRNSYTSTAGMESQMQKQLFYIPNMYLVNDVKSENWKVGLSLTSPYGLATDWADDSFSAYQATESNLEFYQINPSLAYKVNDVLSIGGGIDYMMSYISKHKRLVPALGGGEFRLKGDDTAWGYNLGVLYKPSERHSFGTSYRSKIEMLYEGTARLTGLNAVAQGLYSFTSSEYTTAIKSKLVLPKSLAAGYAFRPDEKWTFEVDLEWTDWSSVQEDFVTYPNESNTTRLGLLNSGNPAAKDWHSSLGYGIGAQYRYNDKTTLRGGYNFLETPIPSANFETALPDSDKHCFTFGLGYKLSDSLTVDASYFGVVLVDRNVTNDVASATSNLDGEYEGYVNIVSVGFTYKY
ncbi:MAG: outer membrane protein transport protein [Candidatus Omnitrophica bacterium]|nr:outer membrane protein transport protein [Candidatus Omnitrophota bacterium]